LWFEGTWFRYKGGAHFTAKEYDLARKDYLNQIDSLNKSIAAFPDFKTDADFEKATTYIYSGWCSINLEEYGKAEKEIFKAMNILISLGVDPGEDQGVVSAVDTLGYKISQKSGKEGGLGYFRRLTSCWDKRHQWWNDFGYFSLETNMASDKPNDKYNETISIFEKALTLKPDYPRYLNDRAMLIEYYLDPEGKHRKETEANFKKAWKLGKEGYESPFTDEKEKVIMFSSFTDALVNLGRIYYLQDRTEECRKAVEEVLSFSSRRPEAVLLKKAINNQLKDGSREAIYFKNQVLMKQ